MEQYATTRMLQRLLAERPGLFAELVSTVCAELDIVGYPKSFWGQSTVDEIPTQRKTRQQMVGMLLVSNTWHSEVSQLAMQEIGDTLVYQRIILSDLFYSIWAQHYGPDAPIPPAPTLPFTLASDTDHPSAAQTSPTTHSSTLGLQSLVASRDEASLARRNKKAERYKEVQTRLDEEAAGSQISFTLKKSKARMRDALPSIRQHRSGRYGDLLDDDCAVVERLSGHLEPGILELLGRETICRDK